MGQWTGEWRHNKHPNVEFKVSNERGDNGVRGFDVEVSLSSQF